MLAKVSVQHSLAKRTNDHEEISLQKSIMLLYGRRLKSGQKIIPIMLTVFNVQILIQQIAQLLTTFIMDQKATLDNGKENRLPESKPKYTANVNIFEDLSCDFSSEGISLGAVMNASDISIPLVTAKRV